MTASNGNQAPEDDTALIARVAQRAYEFGVACARPVEPETFDDPVIHNYYLFFVFGSILWLGDNLRPTKPLDREQKLSALAQAMSFLEPGNKQKIRTLVLMVDKVDDVYAHNIMRAGADTIKRLIVDQDPGATTRFEELLQDPAAMPREIDPEADRRKDD